MARTALKLQGNARIADFISLGVLTKAFPLMKLKEILARTKKESKRRRDLPAHVVIYYVIALALYMHASYREVLRCLIEGITWLKTPGIKLHVTGKSGISQARKRLGHKPLLELHNDIVKPIATANTKGAWYKKWLLVSLDGSTIDVPDTKENRKEFGKPTTYIGESGYSQLRFVSLTENGTHVLFGTCVGSYKTGEISLAEKVVEHLKPGMLCIADRIFPSFKLWKQACATGADLLWRVKKDRILDCDKRLSDGSYLSHIYSPWIYKNQKVEDTMLPVRVIEYKLEGVPKAEPLYRLITTILDPKEAPAHELAALYHERWEIETVLDELKTHLRGPKIVLRSKTPELVKQEFYGLLLAHFAIRGLIHEAALDGNIEPKRLSYIHAVRVVRRKIAYFPIIPPSKKKDVP